MSRNRLPRLMKHYSPAGRRNHGRPLKRVLDTWDRNGSTIGPTPWQIYGDDDIFLPHFNPYRANIELNSTVLSIARGPVLSSNRNVILQCFVLVLPNALSANGCFWTSLDQTVVIHDNYSYRTLFARKKCSLRDTKSMKK